MADIPTELWREILVRISFEELIRLRCVCSSWRNLVDCPMFRVQHCTRPSDLPARNLILYSDDVCYTLGLEKISPDNEPDSESIRAKVVRIETPIWIKHGGLIRGLDYSSNGLFLVVDKNSLFAWNPFSGREQDLHVNDLIIEGSGIHIHYGFGFDEVSRDCKVVLIRHHYENASTDLYVCNLRTPGCWKPMDPLPLQALRFDDWNRFRVGVFVSGALHWMVEDTENHGVFSKWVLAIDLGTEKYRLVLPPRFFSKDLRKVQMYVLGGCLCMSFSNGHTDRLEVWVMKEYGFVYSWSKLLAMKSNDLEYPLHLRLKPLAYSDCGSQVLISLDGDMVWYHLQNKSVKLIKLEGWQEMQWKKISWFTATTYAGSFLPMG